jgi:hypothetical protein
VTAARPVLRHPERALVEQAGESIVVFVPEPESLHLLDGPAALVWQHADGRTDDELCALLQARFPAAEDLERDVRVTVAELTRLGVLFQGDLPAPPLTAAPGDPE